MMKLVSIALALSQLSMIARADNDIGLCCLCDDCQHPVNANSWFQGKQCSQLSLEMADPTNDSTRGNGVCKSLQSRFRNSCCNKGGGNNNNNNAPAQKQEPWKYAHIANGHEPHCNICKGGKFPNKPNTVCAVLYMPGHWTCEDLYWMGRKGRVPGRICAPMQDYFHNPCGC